MIILAIIFPPIIFWALVIAWISYRDKKKQREQKLNRRRQ